MDAIAQDLVDLRTKSIEELSFSLLRVGDQTIKRAYPIDLVPYKETLCKDLVARIDSIIRCALEEQTKIPGKIVHLHANFIKQTSFNVSLYHFDWFLTKTIKMIDNNKTPTGLLKEALLDKILLQAVDKIMALEAESLELELDQLKPPRLPPHFSFGAKLEFLPELPISSGFLLENKTHRELLEKIEWIIEAAEQEEAKAPKIRTLCHIYQNFNCQMPLPKKTFDNFIKNIAKDMRKVYSPADLLKLGKLTEVLVDFQRAIAQLIPPPATGLI
jgi:hypothetical protein